MAQSGLRRSLTHPAFLQSEPPKRQTRHPLIYRVTDWGYVLRRVAMREIVTAKRRSTQWEILTTRTLFTLAMGQSQKANSLKMTASHRVINARF